MDTYNNMTDKLKCKHLKKCLLETYIQSTSQGDRFLTYII